MVKESRWLLVVAWLTAAAAVAGNPRMGLAADKSSESGAAKSRRPQSPQPKRPRGTFRQRKKSWPTNSRTLKAC